MVREHSGVLNSRVLVAIKSQFWVLITALFKNTRTLMFKRFLRTSAFGCRQHNYDHKQRTNEETHNADRNPPITNHKLLFSKRFAKMIDGSEVRKRQLAFELQNSRAFEKCSKGSLEKPRVEEIGILLKACFGSFFNK